MKIITITLASFIFLVTGCSNADESPEKVRISSEESSSNETKATKAETIENIEVSAHGSNESHHENGVEILEGDPVPTIEANVTQDPMGSWLLQVSTTNFTFTPQDAGESQNQKGKGHAHIYIDGEKLNRLYGKWYNLGKLEPGIHEIKVILNANNHAPYSYKGKEIADTVRVNVREK
jgi:hypothetical protein